MNTNELVKRWKAEEEIAHIHGWDFSRIEGRYMEEGDLPWDYREEILRHLKPEMRILDIDTGGGEFLLSLNHPHANTAATEKLSAQCGAVPGDAAAAWDRFQGGGRQGDAALRGCIL